MVDIHACDNDNESYIENLVQKQMETLGDNPSLLEVVSVILKQSAKAECEARKVTLKLEHDMAEFLKIVQANKAQVYILHSVPVF